MPKILIIDDDHDICFLLNKFLTKHNFICFEAFNSKKAIEFLDEISDFDVVLCDYRLEGMDGKVMLKKIKEKYENLPVIIITGYNDIKTAVEMMKEGAFDYILKPLFPEEILNTVQSALKHSNIKPVLIENHQHQNNLKDDDYGVRLSFSNTEYIFGNSATFNHLMSQISLVGPTNYSVIIYGESGSGKEAIAQEIHKHSKRANKPFIAID